MQPAFPMDLAKCDFSTDIMGITIKTQSHSGVILFRDSKVQPNWKLHFIRGLENLNGKFHFY